jgi:MYXO-CTERM domain-containing protein
MIKTKLALSLLFLLGLSAPALADASPVATTSFRFCSVAAGGADPSAASWGALGAVGIAGVIALRRRPHQ